MTAIEKPKSFTPGDFNAFFGFGTNICSRSSGFMHGEAIGVGQTPLVALG